MSRRDEQWQRPEHPLDEARLQRMLEVGIFSPDDRVSLNPDGIVVDDRTKQPYAFSGKQAARAAQVLGIRAESRIAWEYEEYFDHQGQPRLQDSVVCQLDILGTGGGTDRDIAEQLRVTRHAIAAAHRWTDEGIEVTARWFTDNAVIAALDTDWRQELSLGAIALICSAMQLELVAHRRFCRGGIAAGLFHVSELFAYGRPLIDAYRLESQTAVYPRIVFSEGLKRRMTDEDDSTSSLAAVVSVDFDGVAFVNYLGLLTDVSPDRDPAQTLAAHRDAIRAELAADHPEAIAAKYGWVADYHDRFCAGAFADLDVRVSERDVTPLSSIKSGDG